MKRRSPRHYARNTALATLGLYAIPHAGRAEPRRRRRKRQERHTRTTTPPRPSPTRSARPCRNLLSGLNSRRAG
ncbi:hypothetical protein ACPA9J_08420 [Pseudomonas aeruginosa]